MKPTTHVPGTPQRQRVVVVEDDPLLRQLIVRMLLRAGFDTLEAPNGATGLEIVTRDPVGITLVITDIVMPQMDGFELADAVAQRSPSTRVLLMSGRADDSIGVRGGLKEGTHPFLLKPFTQEQLTRAIDLVLRHEQVDLDPIL